MTSTLEVLRHKTEGAQQLESVVRTMKVHAASSIGQYEAATRALDDYYRTVELGLIACFKESSQIFFDQQEGRGTGNITAVVFGSDQGLVGQFNDRLVEFVSRYLEKLPGQKSILAIGDRIHGHLCDAGLSVTATLPVPGTLTSITQLVAQILAKNVTIHEYDETAFTYIFYNHPHSGVLYDPVCKQLLPLDGAWQRSLARTEWPTVALPEIVGGRTSSTLQSLIREYLFISLFRACAESLTSENASRLASMQRAETNIAELLKDLQRASRTLRQSTIDEELFDLISCYSFDD